MIKISVDEATAFDMLAILLLKSGRSDKGMEKYENFGLEIQTELGKDKAMEVFHSEENKNLILANKTVFALIERITHGENIDALYVHNANMTRFYAKQELQKRFFKSELTELKTVR